VIRAVVVAVVVVMVFVVMPFAVVLLMVARRVIGAVVGLSRSAEPHHQGGRGDAEDTHESFAHFSCLLWTLDDYGDTTRCSAENHAALNTQVRRASGGGAPSAD
jgi:hypothetical protein